jgi:hypothetical protein
MRAFENRVPGRIFGQKKDEMMDKYYIKKGLIKLRNVMWTGLLAGMGVME